MKRFRWRTCLSKAGLVGSIAYSAHKSDLVGLGLFCVAYILLIWSELDPRREA